MAWVTIRGHDSAREQILSAYVRGRMAHAYLFAGPQGVGKSLFATELAKALLCDHPPATLTACDECPSCAQVAAGTHPDAFTARKPEDKHELPVEVVQAFCGRLALKATRGPWKVGVIEDADDFNESSANCFLKTLEEPPPGSLLILLATTPDRQLPTILSRCQVVRFRSLPSEAVRAVLADHEVTDPSRADRLVRLAEGSPGRALALNDDALWTFRQSLATTLTATKPDPVGLASEWAKVVEEAGKESSAQRERASLVIRLVIDLLRTALRLSLGSSPGDLGPADAGPLRRLADRTTVDGIAELLDACTEADYLIERKVQLVLVIESLADRLCRPVEPVDG